MLITRMWHGFIRLMEHPLLGAAMIIGNTIGGIIGYPFWYGQQLLAAPLYLWPLIPDSPTSALLFVPAYLLIRWRKPGWSLLNGLAAFSNIKYGLWTVGYWFLFWQQGGNPGWMGWLLTFTHAAMALEGAYLLNYTFLKWPGTLAIIGWFVLQDWADYGPLRLHPGLPDMSLVPAMQTEAIVSTVLLAVVLLLLTLKRRRIIRHRSLALE